MKTVSFRKFKSIDRNHFRRDLLARPLCSEKQVNTIHVDELNACVKEYNTTLLEVLNCHAPIRTRTRVSRPIVPWYSDTIDLAKRQRRKAVRKWRKTKLAADLNVYKVP